MRHPNMTRMLYSEVSIYNSFELIHASFSVIHDSFALSNAARF
jgi:hypothetical protein